MASKCLWEVCYNCGKLGHRKKECPEMKCFFCQRNGHMKEDCPNRPRPSGTPRGGKASRGSHQSPAASSGGRERPPRFQNRGARPQERGTVGKSGAAGVASARQRRRSAASATPHPQLATESSAVTEFFRRYPFLETAAWPGHQAKYVCPSASCGEGGPASPTERQDQRSSIWADEAVKRVSETVFKLVLKDGPPSVTLTNKKFQHLSEKNNADLLFIPKVVEQEKEEEKAKKEGLQFGDFDVIIVLPVVGYVHIEVKSVGYAQDNPTEEKMREGLLKAIDKAVKSLKKGVKVLQYLQPNGQRVSITSTLALPNIQRAFLRRVLQDSPEVKQALEEHMRPCGQVAVEDLCLCQDDLPPPNAAVDESDVNIRTAVTRWWTNVTASSRQSTLTRGSYRCIVASLCNNEEVNSLSEAIQDTGRKAEAPRLDQRQVEIINSDDQYVCVSGPPGSGKSLVLAEKSRAWLLAGKTVFLIFTRGKTTNQPAVEVLWRFVEDVFHCGRGELEHHYPSLHKMSISSDDNIDEFIDHVICVLRKPALGKVPWSRKYKPEDMQDELKVEVSLLQEVFSALALDIDVKKAQDKTSEGETESISISEKEGEGICFAIDELNLRTVKGKVCQLIDGIQRRLPGANIWCASPFPFRCPTDNFQIKCLTYPYRCPPKTQRLLKALEPFCHNEGEQQFQYVTSCTDVPASCGASRGESMHYRLPTDGPDPVFFSHARHNCGEILECPQCAETLVKHLTDKLEVGRQGGAGRGLQPSDVLIVVTGSTLYNNMRMVAHSEFYRQLNSSGLRVAIYDIRDDFDLQKPHASLMHVRTVAGLEKKVVVFVPCRQYQAVPMTYAEAVNPTSDSSQGQPQQVHSLQDGPDEVDHIENSQRRIRAKLETCRDITEDQRKTLSRLGVLNLHWLWYVASRSLAHNIIFHF